MKPFPSTLIIANNTELIEQKLIDFCHDIDQVINLNNPDLMVIDQLTGWGIDKIRLIKKFLSQKPFIHQNKLIVIKDAQNLQTESQNALLKILEEPGDNNFIILTTNKPASLLSTITSRCHLIKLTSIHQTNSDAKLLVPTNDVNKNLQMSEQLSLDKTSILPLLETQLHLYQQQLVKQPNTQTAKTMEKLIKSIQMINANVDPKSALDYFFLV